MPKFVAICGVSSYPGDEDKEVFRTTAPNHEKVLAKIFDKQNPPLKRKDYDDAEEYNDELEERNNLLEEWIGCTDKLAPGVWEMAYDDTGITIVKVA
jgi:hypothetical protein